MAETQDLQRWPRLMCAETARSYLDLGPQVFRREIVKRLPAIVIKGRRHFDREDLDRWVDAQLGRTATKPTEDCDWDRVIDADLQNSRSK